MSRQVPDYHVDRWRGKRTRYCLAIPVLNEGTRIQRLLQRITALGLPELIDMIIIDGGSKDGSLAEPLLDQNGVAGILTKTGPGRLSAQLRCGYAFMLDQGYDGIVTIDGNDKDRPDTIPAFIQALDNGIDFAQASRFLPGGKEENTPWKRRLAVRWVHAPALSIASGFRWTDTTQGFRAYSRRMLTDPRVNIFRDAFDRYELLAYLSYRAPKLGYRCVEIPTVRAYPADEAVPTKISPFRGELDLLITLFKAASGGYDPDP